ncbi:SigB/SigF/SigG family RNA polymerase sigma factor [Dactylosporangium sp. NPDC049140]|uniref:SigB/SigF/SigG family RNA polymerase sigma factor n=1 Tax=Dactylosporangium sp. NPDC049140 TaxID=3155647 RepID=UPI0033F0ED18
MELTITMSQRPDAALLECAGVLDYASAPYLRQIVFEQFDARTAHVAVDVTQVRLVDAAAIKILLYLNRRGEQLDADLQVTGAAGVALSALEIAGAAKQLGVYEQLDWPVEERGRRPVDLDAVDLGHGQWPAGVTESLLRMAQLPAGDRGRARVRNQVIEQCLPAAHRLARRYDSGSEPAADLAQVAALGLVKAVDGFDPQHGTEFGPYATPTITGELKRHFRDRATGIRLPRRLQELRMAVNQARDGLAQQLGRSPTVNDIAHETGLTDEQVIEAMGATRAYRPLSLDVPTPGMDDDSTMLDTIGGDSPEFSLVEYRESLKRLICRLPGREQRILSLRFYGNLSQLEIAKQVGLSQMHVSRLLAHSLDFLRRHLQDD